MSLISWLISVLIGFTTKTAVYIYYILNIAKASYSFVLSFNEFLCCQ